MLLVELKPLIERLNPYCKQALEAAVGNCVSRGNYEVTVDHFLFKLFDNNRADFSLFLDQHGVDAVSVCHGVNLSIETMRRGNAARPALSPILLELLQDAWLIASIEFGEELTRSAAVLVALSARLNYYATADYAGLLRHLSRSELITSHAKLCAASVESFVGDSQDAGASAVRSEPRGAIARFCEDFTEKARAGKIDPVFGRDREIRQMIDVLARRRKNNPICVGEPGVGKTAVVEGLALRVVEEDIPDSLRGVTILGLDMGLLEAGASVKGEFEARLKSVISEVKAASNPTIIFIDEAHTLIGSGGKAGTSDAANLLKPALARGELRTIAATTWAEYKKYFEKDAALARRFQLIKLDEPSLNTTVSILRGLKEKYEDAHNVVIRDDAIVAVAELSSRYLTGRRLPDKAVDVLDTACARVKVLQTATPESLESKERLIQGLQREKKGLERDRENHQLVDSVRLEQIEEASETLRAEVLVLRKEWEAQKASARALLEARDIYHQGTIASLPKSELDALSANVGAATDAFRSAQEGVQLVRVDVDPDVVAGVISDWTGVPVGKMLRDRAKIVLGMEDSLKARIRGQDHAIEAICEVMKVAQSGLKDPRQPVGVFLLAGPSGVGKTETALAIADILFGDERAATVINMSEYQERHNVSRLIGSPPGYVGYGEGGLLTEAVRQRPYSVILLDEAEKAHTDVVNLFYQVFDKGQLSDGEGKEVDFANTVIFLTSNLAGDVITEMTADGAVPDMATLVAAIRPILSAHFKPALLARMTVVPYCALAPEFMAAIVRGKLAKIAQRVAANHKMRLSVSESVIQQIAARCTDVDSGARNIDHILAGKVLPLVSQEILGISGNTTGLSEIELGTDDLGEFTVQMLN